MSLGHPQSGERRDESTGLGRGVALARSSVQGGLMWSERKHGFFAESIPVSAYVGSSKNLKNLKDSRVLSTSVRHAQAT